MAGSLEGWSLGKQAGSAILMSKAGCLFGVCCGECSHNPPRTISMMLCASITSRCQPAGAPSPGQHGLREQCRKCAGLSPQPVLSDCTLLLCRLTLWSPAATTRSLITSICICENLGPDRASHLPEVTQLLSKDLSPNLSAPSQELLALKSWEQRSCYSDIFFCLFVYTFRVPDQNTGVLTY